MYEIRFNEVASEPLSNAEIAETSLLMIMLW